MINIYYVFKNNFAFHGGDNILGNKIDLFREQYSNKNSGHNVYSVTLKILRHWLYQSLDVTRGETVFYFA